MTNANLTRPIKLTRLSRYGEVGQVRSDLDYGVRATLVEAGRAEWVADTERQPVHKSKKDKQ